MRSRYSAFSTGDSQYLLDTWHASTRPSSVELDPAQRWIRLKIIDSTPDEVEFIATCKLAGRAIKLHERSRFRSQDGRWFYLDGDIQA